MKSEAERLSRSFVGFWAGSSRAPRLQFEGQPTSREGRSLRSSLQRIVKKPDLKDSCITCARAEGFARDVWPMPSGFMS